VEIVQVLADAGYEALSLDLQGYRAAAQVTNDVPAVTNLQLQKINNIWQIMP
jgi:hypothetical protein